MLTWDRFGRILISAPFTGVFLLAAANVLIGMRDATEATVAAKAGMILAALALTAIGIGIAVMIITADNAVWCTKDHANDPRCKQVGGG
jgi:hypothetical protein